MSHKFETSELNTPVLQVNVERSLRVAGLIAAEKKQCWANCVKALLVLDELAQALYVEGFAVSFGIPFAHGWIVDEREIIDPTFALLGEHQAVYFPGLLFTHEQAEKMWSKSLPCAERDGHGGYSHRSYLQAWKEALAYAQKYAQQKK